MLTGKNKFWFLVGSIGLDILIIDQILKWAFRDIDFTIIPGFLRFTYEQNTGIAFGLPIPLWMSAIMAVLLIVLGGIFVAKNFDFRKKLGIGAVGLILGGALGNLVDRVVFGHVVDYISIWKWPVFNLADAAILIGAVTIALKFDKLTHSKTKK